MIAQAQMIVMLIVSLAVFAMAVWAVVMALRFRADAYTAAGKRSKAFWGLLTGGAAVLAFLSIPYPLGIGGASFLLLMVSAVISGLFLADVLPALRAVMGRAQGRYGRR